MVVRSVPKQTMEEIARAIGSIRYGYVQIVIQDSRVVQIEKAEKIRLDRPSRSDGGRGPEPITSQQELLQEKTTFPDDDRFVATMVPGTMLERCMAPLVVCGEADRVGEGFVA